MKEILRNNLDQACTIKNSKEKVDIPFKENIKEMILQCPLDLEPTVRTINQ